jgi:hypothetical protein
MQPGKEAVAHYGPCSYLQQRDRCVPSMGQVRRIPTVGRTKRVDASVEYFYLIACLAPQGCTRERAWRRLPGWFGTPAIEDSSDDRDIGPLPATRRGAKSLAVAYSRVLACGRLQHGAIMTTEVALNALRYRPTRLRHRVSILRGPVSHADDQLGVSRERYLPGERRSR